MRDIGDVPELAEEWLRSRPQFCPSPHCGLWLPEGLPCLQCEKDEDYGAAVAWYAKHEDGYCANPACDCSGDD